MTRYQFQHAAARRRLAIKLNVNGIYLFVSTRSRPKAAGSADCLSDGQRQFQHAAARRRLVCCQYWICRSIHVSTRSRPKAAGSYLARRHFASFVSTRSRPKAAGCLACICIIEPISFNTQPPEGGWIEPYFKYSNILRPLQNSPKSPKFPPRHLGDFS